MFLLNHQQHIARNTRTINTHCMYSSQHVATAEARHVALLASWSGTRVSGAPGGKMIHFQ